MAQRRHCLACGVFIEFIAADGKLDVFVCEPGRGIRPVSQAVVMPFSTSVQRLSRSWDISGESGADVAGNAPCSSCLATVT